MSEYQYYEFQALDQPLDAKQRAELRKYSTRARITSRSFSNEYNWGDFKGESVEWMQKYFDAHLYLSNFGYRHWHVRVLRGLVDLEKARRYEVKRALEIQDTPTHIIFSFYGNQEEWDDYDDLNENPTDVLPSLLPLRDLLARGDMRPLYIAWLAGAQNEDVSKDAVEPPVPLGYGEDSGALRNLADFLWLSPALLQVAAPEIEQVNINPHRPTTEQMKQWIRELPVGEKEAWLLQLLEEPANHVGINFRRAFSSSLQEPETADANPPRTVAQLLNEAEALAERQQKAAARDAAEKKAKEAREAQEARQLHLKSLQGKERSLWKSVTALTATSVPANYDAAVKQLIDLRDLAEMSGAVDLFKKKFDALRELRRRKSSLLQRIRIAGLA